MTDDTKALPHVVTALIARRREIPGQIEDLQRQMKERVAELDHIEARLRIFAPDIDLEELNPRPVPPLHAAFKGEVTRILLEALRKTTTSLGTRELTYEVMRWRGTKTDDAMLVRLMQQRVTACLGHWRTRGYLKSQPAQDAKGCCFGRLLRSI
jgi:hypothetical protein